MRLDLHVHSLHSSDGSATPSEIIRQARKYGLNGVAITDHNSLDGANQARSEAAEMKDFVVVRGMEVSAKEGHVLVYGTDETMSKGLAAAEVVERARELGGIAVAAHPFRFWTGVGEKVVRNVAFTAVEGLNSRSHKAANARAREIALELQKPAIGGSDAHDLGMVGVGVTVFESAAESEAQAIELISKGQCHPEGMSASPAMGIRTAFGNLTSGFHRGVKKI
ncbi:MAG: PHP domain-containing protein [Methanobacteriota archaeon]